MREEIDEIKEIKNEITEAVEAVFDRHAVDSAFYPVVIDLYEADENFHLISRERLLDTRENGVCMFCGADTYYFSKEHEGYVCAKCYAKLKKEV